MEQPVGTLFISSISLAEIAAGYGARALDAPELTAFLEVLTPVPFDAQAARCYGALPFRCGRFDCLIAAHALALGATLVTNTKADFASIPGLAIENWTIPA